MDSIPRVIVSPADGPATTAIKDLGDSLVGVDPDRGRVVWMIDPDAVDYIASVLEDDGMIPYALRLRRAAREAVEDTSDPDLVALRTGPRLVRPGGTTT